MSGFKRPLFSLLFLATVTCSSTVLVPPASGTTVPMPEIAVDITDSKFCQKARYDRDLAITTEPDLSTIDAINLQDASLCFTPDENLYFVANQEAQSILGPHAPWYLKISKEFTTRVKDACKVLGYENDDISRAFDHCVENRFEELIGPYNDKYRREASTYVQKRKEVAESLVVRCDAALSIKRKRLPRDLKFPLAYYDRKINSFPNWFLEEKLDDSKWLERMTDLNANELMNEVLGKDCPGNMVYWVTYESPSVL